MYVIQSIERAFEILRALSVGPGRISDLAEVVGLPKSTVARMLFTLEQVGAVVRVEGTAAYRLGETLGELAAPRDLTTSLVVSIKPHLAQLASTLGEAAGFSVPEGYAMHYLDQVDSPRPIQVRDYSGSLAPMHLASAGLCVMASWPEAELARYLSRPLERNTPQSLVDPAAIRRRLVGIREAGYAWVHEEFAEGLSSVAAPIHGPRRVVVGAITVHGPTYRFPGDADPAWIGSLVLGTAARFSASRIAA